MKFNKVHFFCILTLCISVFARNSAFASLNEEENNIKTYGFQIHEIIIPHEIAQFIVHLTIQDPGPPPFKMNMRKLKYQNLYSLRLVSQTYKSMIDKYLIDKKILFPTLKPEICDGPGFWSSLFLVKKMRFNDEWSSKHENKVLQIMNSVSQLKTLEINQPKEDPISFSVFINLLTHKTSLEQLWIFGNITLEDSVKLIQSISLLMNLKSLIIQENNLSIDVSNDICSLIQKLSHLTYLSLEYNGIGNTGAKIISENLEFIPYIETLDFSISIFQHKNLNPITDQGAFLLAKKIIQCKNLTELNLSNNSIQNLGIKALEEAKEIIEKRFLNHQFNLKIDKQKQ